MDKHARTMKERMYRTIQDFGRVEGNCEVHRGKHCEGKEQCPLALAVGDTRIKIHLTSDYIYQQRLRQRPSSWMSSEGTPQTDRVRQEFQSQWTQPHQDRDMLNFGKNLEKSMPWTPLFPAFLEGVRLRTVSFQRVSSRVDNESGIPDIMDDVGSPQEGLTKDHRVSSVPSQHESTVPLAVPNEVELKEMLPSQLHCEGLTIDIEEAEREGAHRQVARADPPLAFPFTSVKHFRDDRVIGARRHQYQGGARVEDRVEIGQRRTEKERPLNRHRGLGHPILQATVVGDDSKGCARGFVESERGGILNQLV
mmetsp:Transcript_4174/g.9916  ORF Transcript_4174/g.9916 Transcript_4174/m.9916 type:complete len:309 (+) Transcript_4174:58-984(+)